VTNDPIFVYNIHMQPNQWRKRAIESPMKLDQTMKDIMKHIPRLKYEMHPVVDGFWFRFGIKYHGQIAYADYINTQDRISGGHNDRIRPYRLKKQYCIEHGYPYAVISTCMERFKLEIALRKWLRSQFPALSPEILRGQSPETCAISTHLGLDSDKYLSDPWGSFRIAMHLPRRKSKTSPEA
jgi:hypothetical protein